MQRFILTILTVLTLIGTVVYAPAQLPALFGVVSLCLVVWVAFNQLTMLLAALFVPFEKLKELAASIQSSQGKVQSWMKGQAVEEGCNESSDLVFRSVGGVVHFAALCIFLLVDYYLIYEVARGWSAMATSELPLPFADSPEMAVVACTVTAGAFWGTVLTDCRYETNFGRWHTLDAERRELYVKFACAVFVALAAVYVLTGLYRAAVALEPVQFVTPVETSPAEVGLSEIDALRIAAAAPLEETLTGAVNEHLDRFGGFVQLVVHPTIALISLGSSIVAFSSILTLAFVFSIITAWIASAVMWMFSQVLTLIATIIHYAGRFAGLLVAITAFLGAAMMAQGQSFLDELEAEAESEAEEAAAIDDGADTGGPTSSSDEESYEDEAVEAAAYAAEATDSANSRNWSVFDA